MTILRLFVLSTALCLAGSAQAQNNWNAPGSACVPTDVAIKSDLHKTNISSVRFANGAVGQIVLICPMTRFNSGTASYNLKLTYQDSTGTGTTASVTAQAYMMANATSTPVLLGSVESDTSALTTVNTVASAAINHTYDFEANIYWVRVLLKRAATNETVFFHSVVLDGTAI